jgi:hypothetical protein
MRDIRTHRAAQLILDRGLVSREALHEAYWVHVERPSMSLTDALLLFGYLTFDTLRAIRPELHSDWPLGKQLVKMRLLKLEQLEQALAIQERDGGSLASLLVMNGWCGREAIAQAIRKLERAEKRPLAWRLMARLAG